jgi:hypothetical protein
MIFAVADVILITYRARGVEPCMGVREGTSTGGESAGGPTVRVILDETDREGAVSNGRHHRIVPAPDGAGSGRTST